MYGLQAKLPEIFANLAAIRKGPHKVNGVSFDRARNISLRQYIAQNFKDSNGRPLSPGHLFSELNIDPSYTSANELYQREMGELVSEFVREGIRRGLGQAQREMLADIRKALQQLAITGEHSGGERFITPEVFMDPVLRGAIQNGFYQDLIIREVMVKQPTVTVPKIERSDAGREESGEAVTAEVGTVNFGKKTVEIEKYKKGIEITDEAILFNSLDLMAIFFEDLGAMLAADMNTDAVEVIISGDQDDLSEAAAVIGVASTVEGFQYIDILRVWVRLSLLGRRSTSIIGNEETALDYLDMPEVKSKNQLGSAMLQTNLKTPLPTDQDLYVSVAVPANQLVFEDASKTLVQLTARALMIESDRDVKKGLNGSYAQIWSGFSNVQRNSRVVLDKSVAFNPTVGQAGGWPTWMKAYGQ